MATPQFEAPFTLGAQLDARAGHAEVGRQPMLRHDDRVWTYAEFRDHAVRVAHFLARRIGAAGRVAILLENRAELLSIYAGCGYAGMTLFGVNTGLRGETLAGVINQSGARILIADEKFWPEIDRVADQLRHVPVENRLVVYPGPTGALPAADFASALDAEVGPSETDTPSTDVTPDTNLMVIYTSGTTGLPKGINNNHFKLLAIGTRVSSQLGLDSDAVGYACMPLFHSNAMFLGFQPAFHVGGSIGLRERFSASRFVPDVLTYGVTYWNYVGEPLHYILSAVESAYGGDEARIARELTSHPDNRLRYAVGNGAAPPDIDRFSRWFGLDDMFELYGSTEAAISTFRKKGDPRGSVGEITDERVVILGESGEECPPASLDEDGKILNYAEAVGEICRVAADTALFQGYFDNRSADASKYRDGVYHSGDLGHILVREGARYLFFDGRTDDWIRKDGENFSAAQVARLLQEHPDVVLAAAYGVPCPVSDEWVMAAVKLREDAQFDPQGFFDFCQQQVDHGGMDPKWFPDFVRVVQEFEYTQTQKVLVRELKKVHFDRARLPDEPLFWRQRADTGFREFTRDDYHDLRDRFARAERIGLLDH